MSSVAKTAVILCSTNIELRKDDVIVKADLKVSFAGDSSTTSKTFVSLDLRKLQKLKSVATFDTQSFCSAG